MKVEMIFQDPNEPSSKLAEIILRLAPITKRFTGIFAFATRSGISALFDSPSFERLLKKGSVKVVVGIDAVTTDIALGGLINLETRYESFKAYAFANKRPKKSLFHPKVCQLLLDDDRLVSIVGSNNLTLGGISNNYEFFTIIETDKNEIHPLDLDSLLNLLGDCISPIDFQIINLARRNVAQHRKTLETLISTQEFATEIESDALAEVMNADLLWKAPSVSSIDEEINGEAEFSSVFDEQDSRRILLSEVPRAGDRWQQIHFNKDIMELFFQADAGDDITLQPWKNGIYLPAESRQIIYSTSNKNYKFEATILRGEVYPPTEVGRPLMVILEKGLREFSYLVLFPGDDFYEDIHRLNKSQASIGKGSHRSILKLSDVLILWPTIPLK